MVELFDAFVEAYEHGFAVVVVVEQVVLISGLGSHRAPEGGQFPWVYGRVELDGEKSEFCHHVGW